MFQHLVAYYIRTMLLVNKLSKKPVRVKRSLIGHTFRQIVAIRFARNREDSIIFKAMLRKAGIQVVSVTERLDDTPTGRLLEAMIESLDEFCSANLGEEVVRGMRESASRGLYVGSYAPYGYRKLKVKDGSKDRVKLEPETYQAEVVKRIFRGITEGNGLVEIAKQLNSEGIVD